MFVDKTKPELCRARSCKYGDNQGVCNYLYVKNQTRTKALMDMYGLPAGSPELKRLRRPLLTPARCTSAKKRPCVLTARTGQVKKKPYSCG